jgi:hypothetical protein
MGTERSPSYPCPCCGYLVFRRPPGSDAICPICSWADDALQLRNPTYRGGANGPSLIEAQRTFLTLGAKEQRSLGYVRKPGPEDVRDPGWRPVDPERDTLDKAAWESPWPDDYASLYCWRSTFWRLRK